MHRKKPHSVSPQNLFGSPLVFNLVPFHLMNYIYGQKLKARTLSSMPLFLIACALAISLQATFRLHLESVYLLIKARYKV